MSRGGSQHTMKMDSVRHEESTTYVPFSEETPASARRKKRALGRGCLAPGRALGQSGQAPIGRYWFKGGGLSGCCGALCSVWSGGVELIAEFRLAVTMTTATKTSTSRPRIPMSMRRRFAGVRRSPHLGHLWAFAATGCRQRWQTSPDGCPAASSIGPAHTIPPCGNGGCRRL